MGFLIAAGKEIKMNIKAFHAGQIAFLIQMYTGRDQEPKIRERNIAKVGRMYVTDDQGRRYKSVPALENGLIEENSFAGNGFLFPTLEDAKNHIERHKIIRTLSNLSYSKWAALSLNQLSRIQGIIGEGDKS